MSFWESKHIKSTRKPHRCEYCGAKIPIGSSCRNEVGTNQDGDFNHYYLCDRCVIFLDKYHPDNDGWLGELAEDINGTNLLDCPTCGSNNRRVYDWKDDMSGIELECDDCDHVWTVDLSLEALRKE